MSKDIYYIIVKRNKCISNYYLPSLEKFIFNYLKLLLYLVGPAGLRKKPRKG